MGATLSDNTTPRLPQVAIVVAMTADRVIGADGHLPWQIPDELRLFGKLTAGGTLLMGRRTFESIGRPLPGRASIVLTRGKGQLPGATCCNGFMAGLTAAAALGRPVFVIGGAEVYRRALPIATEMHISWIRGSYPGDARFPDFDPADWLICSREEHPEFRYEHYRRRGLPPGSRNACGKEMER